MDAQILRAAADRDRRPARSFGRRLGTAPRPRAHGRVRLRRQRQDVGGGLPERAVRHQGAGRQARDARLGERRNKGTGDRFACRGVRHGEGCRRTHLDMVAHVRRRRDDAERTYRRSGRPPRACLPHPLHDPLRRPSLERTQDAGPPARHRVPRRRAVVQREGSARTAGEPPHPRRAQVLLSADGAHRFFQLVCVRVGGSRPRTGGSSSCATVRARLRHARPAVQVRRAPLRALGARHRRSAARKRHAALRRRALYLRCGRNHALDGRGRRCGGRANGALSAQEASAATCAGSGQGLRSASARLARVRHPRGRAGLPPRPRLAVACESRLGRARAHALARVRHARRRAGCEPHGRRERDDRCHAREIRRAEGMGRQRVARAPSGRAARVR